MPRCPLSSTRTDFDLCVYASDVGGARGEKIGESTGAPGAAEPVTVPATTMAIVHPDGSVECHESIYVLPTVAYVTVPHSTYQSVARFL